MTIEKEKFVVQYHPGYIGPSGKKAQPVSIKMSNYGENGETRVLSMWPSQFNSMMSCEDSSTAKKEIPASSKMACHKPCKVIARGKYSAGGATRSNPVMMEFKEGKGKPDLVWKGDIIGGVAAKITVKTCDKELSKFKIKE